MASVIYSGFHPCCVAMATKCILSASFLLYPISVQQLKITSCALQHAASSSLQSRISVKYLPGLPISSCYSLEKNVFAPNWFSSSLPIYTNHSVRRQAKHSSESCSCRPAGKKWVSQLCDVWNQRFFIVVRCGVAVCPSYRGIVSQQILECKKKLKPAKETNIKAAPYSFLGFRKRIINLTVPAK